jgi:hypothetical protein
MPCFGPLAEDVGVNPGLVLRDRGDAVRSVISRSTRFCSRTSKDHRKLEQLEKQIESLSAALQKVRAELQPSKVAPKTIQNNQ